MGVVKPFVSCNRNNTFDSQNKPLVQVNSVHIRVTRVSMFDGVHDTNVTAATINSILTNCVRKRNYHCLLYHQSQSKQTEF